MNRTTALQLFVGITVLAFIALYAYTGINKLLTLEDFEASIYKSELVRPYAKVLSIAIPTTELLICLSLTIPSTRRLGLQLATFLMLLFTFYVIAVLSFSNELPCTCGGFINTMTWQQHLFFNLGFLTLGSVSLFITKKNKYAFAI